MNSLLDIPLPLPLHELRMGIFGFFLNSSLVFVCLPTSAASGFWGMFFSIIGPRVFRLWLSVGWDGVDLLCELGLEKRVALCMSSN